MAEARDSPSEWIAQVKDMVANKRSLANAAAIPRVATPLMNLKREAYIPHFLSLGPYHHRKPDTDFESSSAGGGCYQYPELKMSTAEAYKVQSATPLWQRGHNQGRSVDDIVENIQEMTQVIERFYDCPIISREDRYFKDFALMMTIDAYFLLSFLIRLSSHQDRDMVSLSTLDVCIKCDILKLENQIPLSVLKRVFENQRAQGDNRDFNTLLVVASEALCPFDFIERANSNQIKIANERHLLGSMHKFVSPFLKMQRTDDGVARTDEGVARTDEGVAPTDDGVARTDEGVARTNEGVAPTEEGVAPTDEGVARTDEGVAPTDEGVARTDEGVAPTDEGVARTDDGVARTDEGVARPTLLQSANYILEVVIAAVLKICVKHPTDDDQHDFHHAYNAGQMVKSGIKFKSFANLTDQIRFDTYSGTLYLPRITVSHMQTEVFLRNMMALEFNDATGHNQVTRYVGLMDCIIDTAEDVLLLRDCDVIRRGNLVLTDERIAEMWNDLRHPFFTGELEPHDSLKAALQEVLIRKYYKSKLKKVVWDVYREHLRNWKVVAVVVGIFILAMTAVQTYCSIYGLRHNH